VTQTAIRPAAESRGSAPAIVAAEGVSLVYQTRRGTITALENLDLSIGRGEFFSLIGPSGCGKSSFLKVAAGLLRQTSGSMTLDGSAVQGPRREVGVIFQRPTLFPWKTVLHNVLLPAETLNLDKDAARARAEELLKMVGLDEFADNYPNELSGGMQQRVGIVRALIHDPDVLLMDEPFAALDALTREHMMMEFQDIWMTTEKSVLFITHSIPEAVFLSDRVAVMSQRPGRIIREHRVDLDRPRNLSTMANIAFNKICNELRAELQVDL
jgi:NitT/TauT family transport system ATP-binding protein